MIEKRYLSANELLADSFRLGNIILDSISAHIVGIWRGGAGGHRGAGTAGISRRDDRPYRHPHRQLYRHRQAGTRCRSIRWAI
jgi:hypothetical protein